MENKLCFVIMPYGGEDDKRRKHYLGVYQGIIEPAVKALGFETKRSDIAGQPGDITKDIIEDLARADLVVADLSEGNPNVLFELGIRHVLRKSGTIHIVNKDHHIPFDLRQYRAVEYSAELSELTASINEIRVAIEKRISQPTRSDNPVHDSLTQLPVNVMNIGTEDVAGSIRQLQARVEALSLENDSLKEHLREAQENPRANEDKEIDAFFDEADLIMQTTGQNVLLHLNRSLQEGGKNAFVAELRNAVKSPYLSEGDLGAISNMCSELDLDAHNIAVLREAKKRFPESLIFFTHFTSALLRSASAAHKEEGRQLAEHYYGIMQENGEIIVGQARKIADVEELFPLFDHYIYNDKPAWALALMQAAETVVGEAPLLLRSKARALAKLRRNEEAEGVFRKAIDRSPNDDTLFAFYSDFLDDAGRFEEAYENIERALQLDPQDGTRFVNVAVQILNRGVCRNSSGELHQLIARKPRMLAAAPFLIGAITQATVRNRTRDVIGIFAREHMLEEAQALSQNQVPRGNYDYSSYRFIFPDTSDGN